MKFGLILATLLLGIVLFSIKLIARYNKCENIAVSPFKCSECEKEFRISAARVLFSPNITLALSKKLKLKCPHCQKTNMCKWMSEYDL